MIKLRQILSEAEWGFDLTDFKPGGFVKVLKGIEASPSVTIRTVGVGSGSFYKEFHWKGKGVTIITGNNPISGGPRGEKNYASYIGISGSPEAVKNAVKLIKKYAEYIKGESKNRRDFI